MGNVNSVNISNNIQSDIFQMADNTCSSNVEDEIDNLKIIAAGDVNITQYDVYDFNCVISNTLDSTITNTLTNSISQTATTENGLLLPSFGSNSNYSNIASNVRNNITQIMQNSCTSSAVDKIDNVCINSGGSVNLVQGLNNGNVNKASCGITNTASATVSNDLQNSVSQTAAITNAITTIVMFIVIGIVVYFVFAKKDKPFDKANGKDRD